MSPEERIAHQAKMRSFENYEECSRYQLEHQRLMEARAAQQGVQLRHGRRDVCAELYRHTPGS
ncbi:hypothetical protein GCM10027343_16160 [Noviherbaspirillum agri]